MMIVVEIYLNKIVVINLYHKVFWC